MAYTYDCRVSNAKYAKSARQQTARTLGIETVAGSMTARRARAYSSWYESSNRMLISAQNKARNAASDKEERRRR